MGRTILSVLAGYVTMAVLVMAVSIPLAIAFGLSMTEAPDHFPPLYLGINMISGLAAAIAGGWVCARVAREFSARSVNALALFTIVMGVISAVFSGSTQPLWYSIAITLLGAIGVRLGGRIHG